MLSDAVTATVELLAPGADGVALQDHLDQLERATGKRDPRSGGPQIPEGAMHVWEWFWELDRARGSNGFGPNPISYTEIDAWARMTGVDLLAWELRALVAMDAARLAASAKLSEAKTK